jgi:hypothetical protein
MTTYFIIGLFVGGFIGAAVMAFLAAGTYADETAAYHEGYQKAVAEVKAKHRARGQKAAATRRGQA